MPKKISTNSTVKKEDKKIVKKTAVKKVVASSKKTPVKATKKNSKELMMADNDKSFWVSDGQILNNLLALHEALLKMDEEVFLHHVSDGKNDFADWVDLVLCDAECANELRKAKKQPKAVSVVAKHLKTYKV